MNQEGRTTMTDQPQNDSGARRFRVYVGHAQVEVEGHSAQEAIRRARSRLSLEMPRLWDVIFKLEDAKFRVEEAA